MTYKEKLQIEHPGYVHPSFIGGCNGCPKDYGYGEESVLNCQFGNMPNISVPMNEKCEKCWNKEITEVEVKSLEEVKPEEEIKPKTKDDGEQLLVWLTKSQCKNLANFIECELFDTIRRDTDIDGMGWLYDLTTAHMELKKALKE